MALDLKRLLSERGSTIYDLHAAHINPQFAKVLRTIGFDRAYVRGEGAYLYDEEGQRYLDMLAGYGVFNIGRNHPRLKETIQDCMALDLPNLVQMDCARLSSFLAEALIERAPDGLDKVFFTNSGTESVEGAIKLARGATQKPAILYVDHAFHGLSTGSLALNGGAEFREGFGDLLPHTRKIPFNDLEALQRELARGDVAALFIEPIQGKGVYVQNETYLREARKLLDAHGALLVADEVQTGFGRTGDFFAIEHAGVTPDIITCAKALSGGYIPSGAILMRTPIYKATFSRMDRCVIHSSTFAQNDLAMAAGLATLEILDDEDLVARAARLGNRLLTGLKGLADKHKTIKEVRGRGLMVGIQFGPPRSLFARMKWKLVGAIEKGLFTQVIVMSLLRNHRILTQVAGHKVEIIKLIPPLTITEEDVDRVIGAVDQTLGESSISSAMLEMGRNLGKHALLGR